MSKDEAIKPADLRSRAMALFTPPFKFNAPYIQDQEWRMVADKRGEEDLRVRGWGRISYMPDAEALQDEVGAVIADALNEYWNRRTAHVEQGGAGSREAILEEALRQVAQSLAWLHRGKCRGYHEKLPTPDDALAFTRKALDEPAPVAPVPEAQGKEWVMDTVMDLANMVEEMREALADKNMPRYGQKLWKAEGIIISLKHAAGWRKVEQSAPAPATGSIGDDAEFRRLARTWDNHEDNEAIQDWQALVAYIDARSQPPAVPEGWQRVPKVATDKMEDAAEEAELQHRVDDKKRGGRDPKLSWSEAYRVMLAAAPQPPAAVCRDDGRCQYAIDHGAEGLGHCPEGKCCMPPAAVAPEQDAQSMTSKTYRAVLTAREDEITRYKDAVRATIDDLIGLHEALGLDPDAAIDSHVMIAEIKRLQTVAAASVQDTSVRDAALVKAIDWFGTCRAQTTAWSVVGREIPSEKWKEYSPDKAREALLKLIQSPAQSVALTDDEIKDIVFDVHAEGGMGEGIDMIAFARAIIARISGKEAA